MHVQDSFNRIFCFLKPNLGDMSVGIFFKLHGFDSRNYSKVKFNVR